MSGVFIKDNLRRFERQTQLVFDSALGRMSKDIKQLAKIRVPLKSGDLMKAIEVEKIAFLRYIVAINSDYAGYQERGRRRDGSHVVRRYTTPNTGKDFMKDAGDKVKKDALNYLKQANQLIKL